MKKLSYLLGLMLIAGMVFTSCKKDDDEEPLDLKPIISIKGGAGYVDGNVTVNIGDTVKIGISAAKNSNSGKKLQDLYISLTSQNIIQWDTTLTINDDYYNQDFLFGSPNTAITERILFRVTDKDSESNQISLDVTWAETETVMTYENDTACIWNIIGPNPGAWDLINNQFKLLSEPPDDKDMVNTTTAASPPPEIFEKEWESLNNTAFVKANGFDYDNATVEAADETYEAGTPVQLVSDVEVGDIYIAKLRDLNIHAVIKITNIIITVNDKNDNLDKIEFSYKKAQE